MQTITFPSGKADYYFGASIEDIWNITTRDKAIIITNEHLARLYPDVFRNVRTLVLPPSESSKDLDTVKSLAAALLEKEADRDSTLVGIGGGVVTDITGFLASVYMRGIPFGFVPTSLLAMVDAAVGGKNGVNMGMNKNMLGTIRQPQFILYDQRFLNTLPDDEWSNGFAEIIKYACLFDPALFNELSARSISDYKNGSDDIRESLVEKCVGWKNKTVTGDEFEKDARKLLNFGHTAAHAIENLYELPHGKAVGIGMLIACMISEKITGLDREVTRQLRTLLTRYHLPVRIRINASRAMEILKMDKKRHDHMIDYIVLEKIGKASVHALPLSVIEEALHAYDSAD